MRGGIYAGGVGKYPRGGGLDRFVFDRLGLLFGSLITTGVQLFWVGMGGVVVRGLLGFSL